MTSTPYTDQNETTINGHQVVPAAFARTLETEIQTLKAQAQTATNMARESRHERDQAVNKRDRAHATIEILDGKNQSLTKFAHLTVYALNEWAEKPPSQNEIHKLLNLAPPL